MVSCIKTFLRNLRLHKIILAKLAHNVAHPTFFADISTTLDFLSPTPNTK